MKINKVHTLFLSFFVLLLMMACKSNSLPKVSSPVYSIYNYGDERGYKVQFTLPESGASPSAVVINKVKQPVAADAKSGRNYSVNVIAQSRRIFGFKPTITSHENGIFFNTKDGEVFRPVKFKLVNQK